MDKQRFPVGLVLFVAMSLLIHALCLLTLAGRLQFLAFNPLQLAGVVAVELITPTPSRLPPPPKPAQPVTPPRQTATQSPSPQSHQQEPSLPVADPAAKVTPSTTTPPPTAAIPPPAPEAVRPTAKHLLPHRKERLVYRISWLGMSVGEATIEASQEAGAEEGRERITTTAVSNTVISTFYTVNDRVECQLRNGMPESFRLRQQEGKHRGDKETLFDQQQRSITFVNHLQGNRQQHSVAGELPRDIMSAFYYARHQPLAVGTPLSLRIFDNNKFYTAEVLVLRREKLRSYDGSELPALVIQPKLATEGLFKRRGEIYIWLSDDDARLPLKVETAIAIGTVTAELTARSVED